MTWERLDPSAFRNPVPVTIAVSVMKACRYAALQHDEAYRETEGISIAHARDDHHGRIASTPRPAAA
jgi:hypothetical protein